MEKRGKPPGRPFIVTVLFYIVCFGVSYGHAFEAWLGEVSANVNLRKSPGLDQEIITVLEEATIVEVLDKSGAWYQVVTLWETPERKGWIYARHIRRTSEKVKSPEAPSEIVQEEKKEEPPLPVKKTQAVETLSVVEIALDPEISESADEVTAPEPVSEVEETTETILPIEPEHHPPFPETTAHVDVMEKATPEAKSTDDEPIGPYPWARSLLRSLVRLASVILSCLALIFSFKAFRLAQTCYQEIARLQMRFEDLPKEGGQTEDE